MKVLDKGFLEVVDVLGNDLTTVNAARVSMGSSSDELSPRDEKLIHYLSEHNHSSPFRHSFISFRWKAPISVQRQVFTHHVGISSNSESSRYCEVTDDYYIPDKIRAQSTNNKQGSDISVVLNDEYELRKAYIDACKFSFHTYNILIGNGVAREQAREILPLATYTSWYWTASLAAIAHFIKLRDEDHAQYEIREYSKAMKILAIEKFPVSLKALLD